MLEFRHCGDCGTWFPQRGEHCPSCGRFGLSPRELFTGKRAPLVSGLPAMVFALAFFLPSPFGAAAVGAGCSQIVFTLVWLLWRQSRRDPESFTARISRLRARLDELDSDLEDTDQRLAAAAADLEFERRSRGRQMLQRELAQDRRLQSAQRRLVLQLERHLEALEVERFRGQLRYFEACRDARIDSAALATELDACIRAVEHRADNPIWAPIIEEASLLHRQLERGVARLHAANRLDPLAYADVADEEPADAGPPMQEGELDERTDQELQRIERSFEALEEIAAALVGGADASGVRLRVDDEVMAALDLAREVQHEVDVASGRARVSADGS